MYLPKEIAQPLKQLVTNKPLVDALNAYVNHRINEQHRVGDDAESDVDMRRSQGAIRELKRILNMRDEVLAGDK